MPFELLNGYVVAYGDILLGRPTRDDFPKAGYIEKPKLRYWESNRIPFSIHADVRDPERILRVVQYFNQHTPLKFVPYNGEPDNIVFLPFDELCLSYLGKIGGNQPIYLDDRCGDQEISHELMHALGFIHEHSRADRDNYVRVDWGNVERDKESQFMVTPPELNKPMDRRPFDYNSVMIYPPTMFALDRSRPVLIPIGDKPIEPARQGLSAEDVQRLILVYGQR